MGIPSNRHVRLSKDTPNGEVRKLDIPEEGLKVHLKGYGFVKVFKLELQKGFIRYYITNTLDTTLEQLTNYVNQRWDIEVYHKELKQNCGLERCQAYTNRSQRNHIGLCVLAFIKNQERRTLDKTRF